MSVPVLRLVKSLRYALNDMQGVLISDFELLETINQAAALLYGRLSEHYVHAALKKTRIIVLDDSAELPNDFVRVHQVGIPNGEVAVPVSYLPSVDGTYRIIGQNIYAKAANYDVEYYYIPTRVTKLSDNLDIPLSMCPYIEQISLSMFNKDIKKAEELANACTQILSNSAVSHLEGNNPHRILGGSI